MLFPIQNIQTDIQNEYAHPLLKEQDMSNTFKNIHELTLNINMFNLMTENNQKMWQNNDSLQLLHLFGNGYATNRSFIEQTRLIYAESVKSLGLFNFNSSSSVPKILKRFGKAVESLSLGWILVKEDYMYSSEVAAREFQKMSNVKELSIKHDMRSRTNPFRRDVIEAFHDQLQSLTLCGAAMPRLTIKTFTKLQSLSLSAKYTDPAWLFSEFDEVKTLKKAYFSIQAGGEEQFELLCE